MQRITITLENEQDFQKTASALVPNNSDGLQDTLIRANVEHKVEEIEDQDLYTIDVANSKGGRLEDLRTREECLNILRQNFDETEAKTIFLHLLKSEKYIKGQDEITLTKVIPTLPKSPDEAETQDQITNILLETHRNGGLKATKALLRLAVANFACEYAGGENDGTGEPDEEILRELGLAIQTPVFQQ